MKSPRLKVASMLMDLGFSLNEDDFSIVRGPKCKQDILECWSIFAGKDGKTWNITSMHTMTELARKGLTLKPGTHEAQIYGDFLAEPKT